MKKEDPNRKSKVVSARRGKGSAAGDNSKKPKIAGDIMTKSIQGDVASKILEINMSTEDIGEEKEKKKDQKEVIEEKL